jgi:hypothetical protein
MVDRRSILFSERFDHLLVAGRIAGIVPKNGHRFSSSLSCEPNCLVTVFIPTPGPAS